MDCRSAAGYVRRIGLRRAEFGDAGIGRIVSLSAGDLRTTGFRAADFVSVHLAAFFSAPLSIASGAIGLAGYASYFFPGLQRPYTTHSWAWNIPLLGPLQGRWMVSGATFVAIGMVVLAVALLYRKITSVGWMSKWLLAGVIATMGWIIFAGFSHFHAALAFDFPSGAFHLSNGFFLGLGSAMLVASYDYWGYYNICFLGDEIKEPSKTIPRAMLLSIFLVSCLYIAMNVSILGVLPWREIAQAGQSSGVDCT